MRYPADPPTVEEIVAVMRHTPDDRHGRRLRAMVVVLWRAGRSGLSGGGLDLVQRRRRRQVTEGGSLSLLAVRRWECVMIAPNFCGPSFGVQKQVGTSVH
jgi:hypothetical protein